MDTILYQLPLNSDADLLLAHKFARQLTANAGLSVKEQDKFGVEVLKLALSVFPKKDLLTYMISQPDGKELLRCTLQSGDFAEIVVPSGFPDLSDEMGSLPEEIIRQQRESYRDMQQFTLALSHDLRKSIGNIKLGVSLVEREEIPPAVKNYIDIIHRASERLENTMRGLNDILRLRHASGIIKKIIPAKIFEEVREDFAEHLSNREAKIETDFEMGEINYVESYLQSIFSNAVSNAVKYAQPGKPLHLKVTGSKRKDGFVLLQVTDNGSGIDLAQYGETLFDPFTRFHDKTEGTGLGLYLLKNMVERNNGRIEVSSKPGEGTTFHFYLREY